MNRMMQAAAAIIAVLIVGCGSGEPSGSGLRERPVGNAASAPAPVVQEPVKIERKESQAALDKLKSLGVDVEWNEFVAATLVRLGNKDLENGAVRPEIAAALGELKHVRQLVAHDVFLSDLSFLKPHKELDELVIYNTPIGDADLAALADLTKLRVLELRRSFDPPGDITDEGLKHLSKLKNLSTLEIHNNRITDAGIVHLKGLVHLSALEMNGNRIEGKGLAELKAIPKLFLLYVEKNGLDGKHLVHLKDLPSLERLSIGGNNIRDDDLAPIEGSNIRDLSLAGNAITTSGLKRVLTLRKLQRLSIANTALGDQDMKLLADLPELDDLDLSGTKVTDEGLKAVAQLPKLRNLLISRCDISDAGIENLLASQSLKTVWMIGDSKVSDEMKKKVREQKRISFLL